MNRNYTQQQFENDSKTANFIFNKYFSKYKFYKEDMIQESLIHLFKARKTFKTGSGATYKTYACSSCYNCMFNFIRSNCNEKYIFQSLSDKITDDLTIEDTIGEEMQINELGLDRIFNAIKRNVKRKLGEKSNSYLKFIDYKLALLSNTEIKQKLNCSRQFVHKLSVQLKNDIVKYSRNLDIAKEIDYYANNN